ncbi:MAG: hypothetical protein KAV98_01720 [Dehalococcoidia bacterium]|nr:hypothetical protein [Dehalococcoidia bacterium]
MEKTWKPTTAGILSIIAGAMQTIGGIVVAVVGGTITRLPAIPMMPRIVGIIAIPIIILGIVAIVGGIYALKRKVWGLALAGCICSLFGPWFLGVPAIIFVAMGKGEFE